MKTYWRRLEDVFRLHLQKTYSRRLDQDEYVRLTHTSSEDALRTSWSRAINSSWSYVFKTFSRCLQDIFKTSSGHLQDILQKLLQDIFKTSSRRFENPFKTSLRHLQNVLQRFLQDIFKRYCQVRLFLVTQFQDVFETYSKRFSDVLLRRLSTGGLLRSHLWEIYGQCTKFPKVIKFSQVLVFQFTTPFSGCLQRSI